MLRCKFKVDRIAKEQACRTVALSASVQKDGDNQDWSKWTPSGKLEFVVTNDAAWPKIDAMNVGDHFWIDITPVKGD